ncbi:hypothetical protein BKP35_16495 [Anaerobacillus arseniciselenatis]|uniref:Uncharacterized protein n=1 Tax=Anaerobacillus arseniciselenatis TaxID=85682 RepID=A0A1S2LBP6_9BACI|nr:hypothetical protein [Anaerobacillus arseniciselenatis]OIJ09453.1 hypothetical protein BKP35_16495 [Anaerobacillus arseniciselenatis]
MAILKNKLGLEGRETTPVAISTEFWQQLITTDRLFDDKSHDSNSSYDLKRVTNTDLDLMIILHKICNTNGSITETTIHQIYHQVCLYFETPPSKTQFYISIDKFITKELIFAKKNKITGLYTYKLNHFINRETGKLHRYGLVSEEVFTSRFTNLSLAARKAFLMTAIKQGKQPFIFHGIHGENGLFKLLKKNQPNQIREVLDELTEAAEDKPGFLAVAKLEKHRGRYHKVYFGLHDDYKVKAADGQEFRDPIKAPVRYPRKAKFIERLLMELGIAELKEQMALLVNCLKNLGFRVIRQVLRQIKAFVTKNGQFPSDLAYTIMKEARIQRDCEIRDLAHELGIFKFIAPGLKDVEIENRLFEFSNAMCRYSNDQIRKMFKSMKQAIEEKFSAYIMPSFEDYCFDNQLSNIEVIHWNRAYAYRRRIDVNTYRELENHAILFELDKGEEHVYDWLNCRIEREKPIQPTVDSSELKIEKFILANSPNSLNFQN